MIANHSNPKQQSIVIVDDEPMVTESIKSFLMLETDFNIVTFQSPIEALKSFEKNPPDLIISDFLMPDMNGLEFLKTTRLIYPDVPRILLTAYADKENAINSINEVGLFQYVQKPWDNDSLRLIIINGLAQKSLNKALQEKVDEIDRIACQKEELLRSQNLVQQELLMAKQVHSKFLLPTNLEFNGLKISVKYKPSFEIGGDFYDVISLANNRTAILVADLTGHGIQAALCTALLKFSFAYYRDSKADAPEIMLGMNRMLYKGLPKASYAAAMIIIVDNNTYTCEFVNGGIPYPVLFDRSMNTIRKLHNTGMMLGMFDDTIYQADEPISFQLNEDKVLYLFTDGLTEINQKNKTISGEQTIFDTIKKENGAHTEEILEKLLQNAVVLSDSIAHNDDITIVGIERMVT